MIGISSSALPFSSPLQNKAWFLERARPRTKEERAAAAKETRRFHDRSRQLADVDPDKREVEFPHGMVRENDPSIKPVIPWRRAAKAERDRRHLRKQRG